VDAVSKFMCKSHSGHSYNRELRHKRNQSFIVV